MPAAYTVWRYKMDFWGHRIVKITTFCKFKMADGCHIENT